MKKLKILELCEFSAGICGVWTRVLSESYEFIKLGHKVVVFSSDIEKGTKKRVKCDDQTMGVKIKRFKSSGTIFTENVKFWFEKSQPARALKELRSYNPDIIITHLLHPHSASISHLIHILKKRNNKLKVIIVPHAPFNVNRGIILNWLTKFWRKLSTLRLNKFDKIIAITKWEKPYLKKLGAKEEKIVYIPNGLPEEYFKQKKVKQRKNKDVLFLGRIAPVKNLETLLKAAKLLPEINFSIVGMAEKKYLKKLIKIIKSEKLSNIKLIPPIYDLKKKIKLIDEHKIFILPSKREAMPQVLLEALSRGKIVISSNTDGGKEIIESNKTGFLFTIGNYKELAFLIKQNINGNKKIQQNAIKIAKKYYWKNLIKKYIKIF